MNLVEGLQKELERNRELLQVYKTIKTGAFGAMSIEYEIKEAEKAMTEGDTVKMLACYKRLQKNQ